MLKHNKRHSPAPLLVLCKRDATTNSDGENSASPQPAQKSGPPKMKDRGNIRLIAAYGKYSVNAHYRLDYVGARYVIRLDNGICNVALRAIGKILDIDALT